LTGVLAARLPSVLPLLSLAALTVCLKLPTLTTPAYWDEMGWTNQAHWLSGQNLLRALPGLRPASMFWGHPPGLHLTLAVLWKLVEPSIWGAHLLIACFAALGVCGTFLLARLLHDTRTAWVAALLLLLSPLYLAQSGMFLADVPVAALGVLSAYLALRNRYGPYLVCASYMVLVKETSIALVVALVIYLCLRARPLDRRGLVAALRYAAPLGVIGAFVLLQTLTTGRLFFIYDVPTELFDLSLRSVWRQVLVVTEWIFVAQQRYVFTTLIVLDLALHGATRGRRGRRLFALIVLLSGYSFAVLYFLPRYILPVLPFFYIRAAAALTGLVRPPVMKTAVGIGTVGLMGCSLLVQGFSGNGEYNLTYRDAVRLQKAMIDYVASEFPHARTLTVWPHTSQLHYAVLGYTRRPLPTKRFSAEADLADSDLVLVSIPEVGRMSELRALAQTNGWRQLRRLENGPIRVELYGR
jgi:dolichyl-phosphate-mannose-protein mannosyltransferase